MSPLAVFVETNARALLTLLPALRDASVEAVHDARVAARQLRAALRLIQPKGRYPALDEARVVARLTARAVRPVRDLDMAVAMLDDLERRTPAAGPAAAFCRHELARRRMVAARRLVKRLEGVELDRLPGLVREVPRLDHGLARRARLHAQAVIERITHASGVYFPRRAHAARAEINRLRYLIEFHDPSDTSALKALRKAQEILSDIQDRQVVHDMVEGMIDMQPAHEVELRSLLAMLEAECGALYDRFVAQRPGLLAVCERISSPPSPVRPALLAGTLLSAGAVLAGSVLRFRRAREGRRTRYERSPALAPRASNATRKVPRAEPLVERELSIPVGRR